MLLPHVMTEPEATPAPRSVPEVVLHVEGSDAAFGVRVTDGDGATPAESVTVTAGLDPDRAAG